TVHMRNFYRNVNGGEYLVGIIDLEQMENFSAVIWDVFPTLAHPYEKLYSPRTSFSQIKTDHKLYFLAGKLIYTGEVSASNCVNGGLLNNGNANTCGEIVAHDAAVEWQNQFDLKIIQAAANYGIPPMVVKGIIAQESQFWPEADIEYEYGLGYLSEKGVDVLLTWDASSFLSVCLPSFGSEDCAAGYDSLSDDQQAYLQGIVLRAVGTDNEIDLITRLVKANSIQMGQLIENITGQAPGYVSTYEDMWDFTIANYHVGAGCMAEGIEAIADVGETITFEDFCQSNTDCPTACLFVERVKNYSD
ncbi:MAG: hypothetical protein P8046_13330, partial [Anaerolineales bacterium]